MYYNDLTEVRHTLSLCNADILPRSFYSRPTLTVAKSLLGCELVSTEGNTVVSGRIVEAEAYLGNNDPASHAACGKTPRTAHQWENPGHLYVYLIYGMYHCINIVCEPKGVAGCVLIRALEPLRGLKQMRARRNCPKREMDLCNGPGKLTQAMGITMKHNRMDVTKGPIHICKGSDIPEIQIATSGRIGVSEGDHLSYRFYVTKHRFVSPRKVVRNEFN